jgi:hypothetical protein
MFEAQCGTSASGAIPEHSPGRTHRSVEDVEMLSEGQMAADDALAAG